MICRQGQIRLDTQFEEVAAKKAPQEGVAPTVERWTPNPTVAGSNPVALIFIVVFGYFARLCLELVSMGYGFNPCFDAI